jgi:hypothetical protein
MCYGFEKQYLGRLRRRCRGTVQDLPGGRVIGVFHVPWKRFAAFGRTQFTKTELKT